MNAANIAAALRWLHERWVEHQIFGEPDLPTEYELAWFKQLRSEIPTRYISLPEFRAHGFFIEQ